MTSEPMRDPVTDPLLTPQNSALVVIDYQPSQIQAVTSIDHDLLVRNVVSVARLAKTYGLPIVLSTVNVAANGQPPTIPELRDVLSDLAEIDRTQINSWEDTEFRKAVEATGRKKLVVAALWTEVCLAFPSLGRAPPGLRGVPSRRRRRGDIPGGTPGRPRAHRPGGANPSAGYRWPASSNATGLGQGRCPKWWTLCSLLGCSKGSKPLRRRATCPRNQATPLEVVHQAVYPNRQ